MEIFGVAGSATPLHDGTNSPDYDRYPMSFVIQTNGGDVFIGGPGITGSTDSFTISDGRSVNFEGDLSRGTHESWDLTKIYYVGGPFKLILERKTI